MTATLPDFSELRDEFPVLGRTVRDDKPLVYLDSAATAQKPRVVLDAMMDFYEKYNAAVHRGAHQLAEEATTAYEDSRSAVASFVGVEGDEIVWTSGTSAAINTVAYGFANASGVLGASGMPGASGVLGGSGGSAGGLGAGASRFALNEGDEIVITEAEHHSNLVPWQQLAARTGATLKWLGLTDDGRIDISDIEDVITDRTRIVSFAHASNVTGAIAPAEAILDAARAVGAYTVLDACQTVPHMPVNLADLDVDFAAFSAHKMFGPTGVGALFGKRELLEDLPPVFTGGSMVERVTMTDFTCAPPPAKFEAGTQMIAQVIGFAVATRWLSTHGMDAIAAHEAGLVKELLRIQEIPGVRIIGPTDATDRLAVVAFVVDGVHPHDVGQVLDDAGIAVRVGHHCAQPLHRRFNVPATARASASVYTSLSDVQALREALADVRTFFGMDDA
ncbi:MAG: SufS family cysteine desulfurase [Cellulomonadaceae bacterium]|jgi:cysteine desulfurase/selenocysteine lyase|nr:SufS family cysteine desulfurase [Cellulomonadaceae bacterium]